MSDAQELKLFDREPGETVARYAARMRYLVELIVGIVQSQAGIGFDVDDLLENLDWIIAQPQDAERARVWDLQCRIGKVVKRMTSSTRLDRVLYFVGEMAR